MAHQPLDPRERHTGPRTVHAEGVPEVVDPDLVQPGPLAGSLKDPLGTLVCAIWRREHRISGPGRDLKPMRRQQASQGLGDWHVAYTRRRRARRLWRSDAEAEAPHL
jgi:hypothetical protein